MSARLCRHRAAAWLTVSACLAAALLSTPAYGAPPPPAADAGPAGATAGVVLLVAGDIADCRAEDDAATAALLDTLPGAILTVGDNAYPGGSAADFRACYEPTWGRHKARTRPSPGNHDYEAPGAGPYFDYFGASAGPPGQGYYSFEAGTWHVVSLNSNVPAAAGSAQWLWLRDDLAASRARCTLAYWHHPVFSSGSHGNDPRMLDVWRLLYANGADVVVNGHDHSYERFGKQTPDAVADPLRGIRQFIVGTGGAPLRSFHTVRANSRVRDNGAHGLLKLTLHPAGYAWEFLPVAGTGAGPGVESNAPAPRDSGDGSCAP